MSLPSENPDLTRLQGVVAPEILNAISVASANLREAGIRHALVGGLAVGAHGYPRTTEDVDFLVGDEAFIKHPGGLVTLKLPMIAIGTVRVDFLSTDDAQSPLRPAIDAASLSGDVPIVSLPVLVYMKLKAGRQKDIADVVELLKRGRIEVGEIDAYLGQNAPDLLRRWESTKKAAAQEE